MKKLPIGISTLQDIIDGDYVYVDKTPYIQPMLDTGKYYFLSRPRRFGKSLLVDTLHQLFAGNEALFHGLNIHSSWDWTKQYPVIRFSFGAGVVNSRAELERHIRDILRDNQRALGVKLYDHEDVSLCFKDLIRKARTKYQQQVVILVDEYDKPILDNITNEAAATDIRDGLRNLYSVIKDNDADIRFAFLTGVSKFSKVSVFSGLNNLEDLTLDAKYSALCGYTQAELETNFTEHLHGVDMQRVQDWYNGYNWLGEAVYNPFDILLFISKGKKYLPHWFETATPTFLVDLLRTQHYYLPDLEAVKANHRILGDFDVGRIRLETLLFQTGYLTIKKEEIFFGGEPQYILSYPNREVRQSLTSYLLETYLLDQPQERHSTYNAFLENDFLALEQRFRALFEGIAYHNYTNNRIAEYEGYYASVMYAYLCSLGLDTRTEENSNRGRIDMTLRFTLPDGQRQVYIFEFKVLDSDHADGSAIQQIKDKDYATKYRDGQYRIFLIGIEFSKALRSIVGFDWEELRE